MDCVDEFDVDPQDLFVVSAVAFRLRAIRGVLELLGWMLERREIMPKASAVTVMNVVEDFAILKYEGGFFTATFRYIETRRWRQITVLKAEQHVSPLVTGVVVIPDQQFVQRGVGQ